MEHAAVSDDESLHDFIVDDEHGHYIPEKTSDASAEKIATVRGVSFSSAKAMQPLKTLHPRFQPGATSSDGQRRYLGKINMIISYFRNTVHNQHLVNQYQYCHTSYSFQLIGTHYLCST